MSGEVTPYYLVGWLLRNRLSKWSRLDGVGADNIIFEDIHNEIS